MDSRFELFDHTADIGVRAYAPTLGGLVAPATEGLYTVIGQLVPQAGAGQPVRFEMAGDEPAVMLRDYLAEILRLFETRKQIATEIDVQEFDGERLAVAACSRPLDRQRSQYEHEVKAVTYHELRIRPVSDGFEATYIVDI